MHSLSVVVLGGGLSGVATAFALARAGWRDIVVVERAPKLGGLAGSFERDGHFYPLGYHHILHRDRTLLYFLDALGVLGNVRWRPVRMFFRLPTGLYDLGSLAGFLRFPLPFTDKVRFVRLMLKAFRKDDWSEWHGRSAAELIDAWGGPRVREALFEPLCRLKFELPCDEVSAAWLGARLHFREGSSALGYIPGTNWTTILCDGLTRRLTEMGVRLRLRTTVVALETRSDHVTAAVLDDGERVPGALFVSTIPAEVYLTLLPEDTTPHLASIRYTALVSVVCATRQVVTPDFYWMNLASMDRAACGIFMLNSLNPTIGAPGDTCINFVTHLLGRDRAFFTLPQDQLIAAYRADFREIFGFELTPFWVNVARVPMYSPVFRSSYRNPPVRSTTWRNVYFAGNYRTFPSVASTGTALTSGLVAADRLLQDHSQRTDLLDAVAALPLPSPRLNR
jgi:protoporphyrinogen oxidase